MFTTKMYDLFYNKDDLFLLFLFYNKRLFILFFIFMKRTFLKKFTI